MELCRKGLKSVNVKMTMFIFIIKLGVLGDGHYRWLRGLINPLSMEHRAEFLARTIHRILDFLQL
jgi:hypothetical protein